jgi:hypothetical protein
MPPTLKAIKHANIPINAGFGRNQNNPNDPKGWRFLSILAENRITKLILGIN